MPVWNVKLILLLLIVSGCLVSAKEIPEFIIHNSPTRYVRRFYQAAKDEAVALTCSFKNTKQSLGYYSLSGDNHFTGRPIIWFKVDTHGGQDLIAIGNNVEARIGAFHNYQILTPDPATSILYIPRVAVNHIGYYKCALEDRGLIHQMFYLSVNSSQLVIRHPLSSIQNVMRGSSVRLECRVSYTYPPPLVYWTRGRSKNRGKSHPVSWGPVLKISYMRKDLADIYTCHADDFLTPPVSTSFQIGIMAQKAGGLPKTIMAQYNHVPAGFSPPDPEFRRHYTLTCRSSGNPRISFKWYKDKKRIMDGLSPNLLIHDEPQSLSGHVVSELQIRRFGVQDRGVYQCKAVNRFGAKSHTFRLDKIQGLPKVLQKNKGLFPTVPGKVGAPTDDEDFKPIGAQIYGSGSGSIPTTTQSSVVESSGHLEMKVPARILIKEGSGYIAGPLNRQTTEEPKTTTVTKVSNFTTKP